MRAVSHVGFVSGVLSLRGLLALMVATSHTIGFLLLGDYSASLLDQPSTRDVLLKLVTDTINVPMIFFVISGLAISLSLERKAHAAPAGLKYAIFVVRRVLRLYPANTVAVLGFIALAALFLEGRQPIDFTAYDWKIYPFLKDWLNGAIFNPLKWQSVVGNLALASWSMNLVVWSLYVEVCAIPVLPLFHRIAREKNLYVDAAMLLGLVAVAGLLWDRLWIHYWFAFYLGMMIPTQGKRWATYLVSRMGGARWAIAAACLAMLATGLKPTDWPPASLIQAFGAYTLVSLIVWSEEHHPLRLLDHRGLRWNGRLSYSFYLWHYIVLTIIVHELYLSFAPSVMKDYAWAMFLGTEVAGIALALALAQLTYRYVEEPGIVLGKRLEAFLHRSLLPRAMPQPGD